MISGGHAADAWSTGAIRHRADKETVVKWEPVQAIVKPD